MPQFDLEAARKAGASDDEILSYLSQRSPNFDVQGALKQAPKADVINYLAANAQPPATSPKTTSSIGANPPWYSAAGLKARAYQAADSLTEALPAAGATLGALLGSSGGPMGTVGGAATGGMGGEAAKQLTRRALGFEVPQTSTEAANKIALEGAVQGGIQGATEGAGRLAAPIMEKMASRQYLRALAPSTQENKGIAQDIIPEMMQRGIKGSTESIENQAGQNIAQLRPKLNQAYADLPVPLYIREGGPITDVLKSLDSMKSRYTVDGKVVNQSAVDAINGVQDVVRQHAETISPQSLRRIKQIFDESVSEAGGYTTSDLTTNYTLKAQREASNTIRGILHSDNPSVATLDKEMSFWLDVQQVAKATNLRRTGQEGGLVKTFAPVAAAIGGATGLTHGVEGGLVGALGTGTVAGLTYMMRSPTWRTISAVEKNRLAASLASGNAEQVAAFVTRFGTLGAKLAVSHQQGQPNQSPEQ